MKIENQKDRLEVVNEAVPAMRILLGLVTLFLIYKSLNHLWFIYRFFGEHGVSLQPCFQLPLYIAACVLTSYLASNKRKFIFTQEGIRMIFGPRIYAFFTLKEEFLPQNDINALAILPYRFRRLGPVHYGLHVTRKSNKKHFDLFGLKTEKEALEMAHLIREKLNLPER